MGLRPTKTNEDAPRRDEYLANLVSVFNGADAQSLVTLRIECHREAIAIGEVVAHPSRYPAIHRDTQRTLVQGFRAGRRLRADLKEPAGLERLAEGGLRAGGGHQPPLGGAPLGLYRSKDRNA